MARTISALTLLAISILACTSAASQGSDRLSSEFRGGPTRNGQMHATAVTTPRLSWTFDAGAAIKTSAAITADHVLVTTTDGELIGLNPQTGSVQWRTATSEGALSSPTIDNDLVVFGSRTGVVHAVSLADGSPRWTGDVGSPVLGAPAGVDTGVLVIGEDGGFSVFNPETGDSRLQTRVDGQIRRSAAIKGTVAFVPTEPGRLAAVDVLTGQVRWSTDLAPTGGVGTPAVSDRLVYAASGLDAANEGDRAVVALSVDTGEVEWRYASPSGARVYTPAVSDDRVFVVGEDSQVTALDASNGQKQWSVVADGPVEALPILAGGVLVVATNGGSLAAYDTVEGRRLWSAPIEGVPYSPTALGELIVVATDLGVVYGFVNGPE